MTTVFFSQKLLTERVVHFFLPKQPGIAINWDNYWSPKIFVENVVGDPKVTQSRMLDFSENGEAWVIDRRRVKGIFIEQLELWEFPFDVQVTGTAHFCSKHLKYGFLSHNVQELFQYRILFGIGYVGDLTIISTRIHDTHLIRESKYFWTLHCCYVQLKLRNY